MCKRYDVEIKYSRDRKWRKSLFAEVDRDGFNDESR